MDEARLELLFDFLKDRKQFQENAYNVIGEIKDEIELFSLNVDDYITIIKEKIRKEEENQKGLQSPTSATEIAGNVSSSTTGSSTGKLSIADSLGNISFYTEYIAQTMTELFEQYPAQSMSSAFYTMSKHVGDIYTLLQNQAKSKKTKKETTKDAESDVDKASLKTLTLFGGSTNSIIKAFQSINKSYVKKVTIFSRSIDQVMRIFKKNFSGDDAQKVMVAANTFTNFLKNYTQTISEIDTSVFKKSKIKAVLDTFNLFSEVKASEKEIEKAAKIGETMSLFAQSIDAFMTTLRKTKPPKDSQLKRITNTIRDFIKNISETLKGTNIKRAGEITAILDGMGKGVLKFAKRMMWSGPIMVLAAPGFAAFKLVMKFLIPEFNYLAKNGRKIMEGAQALKTLGWGVLVFSGSVFLSAKLFTKIPLGEAVLGITAVLGVGWLFTKFFSALGRERRHVAKGLQTIGLLSLATVAMTGTLYLMSIAPLDYKAIGKSMLCISALTLMYTIIGSNKVAKRVAFGSAAIGLMGISLMLLTIPLASISKVLNENGDVLWKLPILLGGTAIIYALAGKGLSNIAMGAGAFALIGLSLMIINAPLVSIAKTLGEHGDVLWKLPVFLVGTGLVYALAGSVAPMILLGALSFAAVGASLWTMYHPLGKIAPVLQKNGDVLWKFPTLLTALGVVYAAAGVGTPLILAGSLAMGAIGASLWTIAKPLKLISTTNIKTEDVQGFVGALKSVVKGYMSVLKDISIWDAPATLTMNSIASSLGKFAVGLTHWKGLLKEWTDDDTVIMSNLITSANAAMILGTSPDWIKKQYGVEVSRSGMWLGINATMSLGKNLKKLAEGVREWKEMKLSSDDAQLISDNISLLLSVLPYSVAKVGKMYDDDDISNLWGLFSKKDSDVEKQKKLQYMNGEIYSLRELKLGIKYTRQLGDMLRSLAKGVKYWTEAKITEGDINAINSNIDILLQVLPYTVANVGKFYDEDNPADKAALKARDGKVYTRSQLKYGIKYTKQLGDTLNSLAKGVKYWVDAKITESDVKAITTNVNTILTTIPEVIAQVGKNDGEVKNVGFLGLWSKTDTQRGIDYTIGIGKSLTGLADGVKYWAEAKLTKDDVTAIQENVKSIITTIPSIFAEVGRSKDTDKGFWGLFKSDAEKGIKVVNQLNEPFGKLADVVTKFNTIPNPHDRAKMIGAGVKDMLKQTVDGLLTLTPQKVELFSKFIDPFRKFTDILTKMVKEIKEMGNVNWKEIEPIVEKASMHEANKIEAENRAKMERESAARTSSLTTAPSLTHNAGQPFNKTNISEANNAKIQQQQEQDQRLEQLINQMTTVFGGFSKEIAGVKAAINQINGKLKVGPKGGLKIDMG